jgi:carboxymethylenebutenolidase
MSLEKISFGNDLPGYVAGDASKPAVIVLQEWWGFTSEIKAQAEKLHKDTGYRVLVPDLYKGKVGVDAEEASHLMGNLDFPQAVQEMKQAVAWLREQGAPKVGAIGFCMGGALTFLAAQEAQVDAAAPFYGTPDKALAKPDKIKVPVQVHVGKNDGFKGFADPETVEEFVNKVKAGGNNDVTLFVYDNEGHGFMNDRKNPDIDKKMSTGQLPSGSEESRKLAWSRVEEFFRKTLG